jgi:hypothetical protein
MNIPQTASLSFNGLDRVPEYIIDKGYSWCKKIKIKFIVPCKIPGLEDGFLKTYSSFGIP